MNINTNRFVGALKGIALGCLLLGCQSTSSSQPHLEQALPRVAQLRIDDGEFQREFSFVVHNDQDATRSVLLVPVFRTQSGAQLLPYDETSELSVEVQLAPGQSRRCFGVVPYRSAASFEVEVRDLDLD